MKVAANLAFFYQDVPLLERYARAAAAGFKLVEVPLPYSCSPEDLRSRADQFGIKHSLINAPTGDWASGSRGLAAIETDEKEFRKGIEKAVQYAKTLDCQRIHVMSGIADVNEKTRELYRRNVIWAAKHMMEHNITCLIEPINLYSIPNYHLRCYQQASDLIEHPKLPNLKLQFDVFHAQQISGQLTALIDKYKDVIGYIQVAQVPNRHEPSFRGEINYDYVFEVLKCTNPKWIVGCEYNPSSEDDLQWAILSGHRSKLPIQLNSDKTEHIEQIIRLGSREDARFSTHSSDSSKTNNRNAPGADEQFDNFEAFATSPAAKSPVIDPQKLEALELELEQCVRSNARTSGVRQLFFLLACSFHVRDLGVFTAMFMRNGGVPFLIAYAFFLLVLGVPMAVMEMAIGQYTSLPAFTLFGRIAPAFSGVGLLLVFVRVMYSLFVAIEPRYVVYMIKFAVSIVTENTDWLRCKTYPGWVCHEPQQKCGENEKALGGRCVYDLDLTQPHYTRDMTYDYHIYGEKLLSFTPANIFSMELQHRGFVWLSLSSLFVLALAGLVAYKGTRFFSQLSILLCLVPMTAFSIFLCYSLSLAGFAPLGVAFSPKWEHISGIQCWFEASQAAGKTLAVGDGTMMTFGALGDFKNNILRDVALMAAAGFGLRLLATISTVPLLAFSSMAEDVANGTIVIHKNPHDLWSHLMFVALPSMQHGDSIHQVIATLFYLAMLISMIGYQVVTFEICLGAFYQTFPSLLYLADKTVRYCLITLMVISFSIILGIAYFIEWEDVIEFVRIHIHLEMFLLLIAYQIMLIVFFYGSRRILVNLKTMNGQYVPAWYIAYGTRVTIVIWAFIIPLYCGVAILRTGISEKFRTVSIVSIFFIMVTMMPIYIAIRKITQAVCRGRVTHTLLQTHRTWGPINIHNRRSGEHDERAARILF